jgi:hypothetical protein
MFKSLNLGVAAVALAVSGAVSAGPLGIGSTATPEMIAGWDIDIRPDGTGLPAGEVPSQRVKVSMKRSVLVAMVCLVKVQVVGLS